MSKEVKSIIIDKVIINRGNEDVLLTDPEEIKQEVNHHFQTIAGSSNQNKVLSEKWINQYHLKEDIDSDIYDSLMDEITIEELNYHISQLSNRKASGLTKIFYEMLKYGSEEMKNYIKNMLNDCLRLKLISIEWKLADLYPIPKPN